MMDLGAATRKPTTADDPAAANPAEFGRLVHPQTLRRVAAVSAEVEDTATARPP
eukprot:m.43687 g.43687  ORF g.43687 m.43687 type:complete len:54 (-) comp6167_c0_seq4:139-300(-)